MNDTTTTVWVKQPDIFPAGYVGGDWQVSEGWNVRYLPATEPNDGQHALIDENFYVESKADDGSGPYVVTCQTMYQICTDLDDPGGTEVYCDYEYDLDADVLMYDDLDRAIDSTRRLAEIDDAHSFLWDGRSRIR